MNIDSVIFYYKLIFGISFLILAVFNNKLIPDDINLTGRLVSISGMSLMWPVIVIDFLYNLFFKRK